MLTYVSSSSQCSFSSSHTNATDIIPRGKDMMRVPLASPNIVSHTQRLGVIEEIKT